MIELLTNSVSVAKEAINFRIKLRRKWVTEEYPPPPYSYFIDLGIIFSTLKSDVLKQWIANLSSYNYGQWVFDNVFPKYDNPDEFHSTPLMTRLDENPVQVLGWKETDELKLQGVKQGLTTDYIDLGFEERSEERGIDLEWSFFEHPPTPIKSLTGSGISGRNA